MLASRQRESESAGSGATRTEHAFQRRQELEVGHHLGEPIGNRVVAVRVADGERIARIVDDGDFGEPVCVGRAGMGQSDAEFDEAGYRAVIVTPWVGASSTTPWRGNNEHEENP